MKRTESVDVVEMLVARWPGSRWSLPTMEAYTNALEPLRADLAVAAVLRAEKELDRAPSIAVLREFYGIEKRLAEPDVPIERMLHETPSAIVPAWVKGWCVSRVRYRDWRVWPEQDPDADDLLPVAEQERYMVEGASLSIEDMFGAIGATVLD